MNSDEIKYCPGTLSENYRTYSPACLRYLFNNKRVSHILPYDSPQKSDETAELFMENRKHVSISGFQEKVILILDKNHLRLTKEGEKGTYILKPIPSDLKKADQVPANEHLTMQIAKQVYGFRTAENALIFFRDGTPAYITRRFDVKPDGNKLGKEDFASLAGKTKDNAGANFKYDYSYEELGLLIKNFVPAWRIEIEKYFSLIVFNFLFSNGDAHLKNFSLLETSSGDYILSPAYDLLNSRLHVDDSDFALSRGLFSHNYRSEYFKQNGHAGKEDFIEFARRIGVAESRIPKLLLPFLELQKMVELLLTHSFLIDTVKREYLIHYQTKRNYLNNE